MFGNPVNSGLTLGKVISGISKTLNVANQVIPLYKQAKPMINNAKTILGVLKDMGNNKTSTSKTSNKKTTSTSNTVSTPKSSVSVIRNTNSPVFFL